MNRFFTAPELADTYRLPKHVPDQLFAEVIPVEKADPGEPLFLEDHVDAWLMARYSVTPWRAPSSVDTPRSLSSTGKEPQGQEAFITVAEAQRRYLSGGRSKRWWYRLAKTGQIAHHRVGDSILFRPDDIEKFIAESRRAEEVAGPKQESATPASIPAPTSTAATGQNEVGWASSSFPGKHRKSSRSRQHYAQVGMSALPTLTFRAGLSCQPRSGYFFFRQ